MGDIAGAVTSEEAPEEFVIECMGTLSNILNVNNNIDIYAVAERYNLIPCLLKILDPSTFYNSLHIYCTNDKSFYFYRYVNIYIYIK